MPDHAELKSLIEVARTQARLNCKALAKSTHETAPQRLMAQQEVYRVLTNILDADRIFNK